MGSVITCVCFGFMLSFIFSFSHKSSTGSRWNTRRIARRKQIGILTWHLSPEPNPIDIFKAMINTFPSTVSTGSAITSGKVFCISSRSELKRIFCAQLFTWTLVISFGTNDQVKANIYLIFSLTIVRTCLWDISVRLTDFFVRSESSSHIMDGFHAFASTEEWMVSNTMHCYCSYQNWLPFQFWRCDLLFQALFSMADLELSWDTG